MGGADSALANDAYAVNLNPGGLGFLKAAQLFGQHLGYMESSRYDNLSFGVPLPRTQTCGPSAPCPGSSWGGSVQYFGGGSTAATDIDGNPAGDFSSSFAVYNLSAGHAFTPRLAFGVTGKWINTKIADVSAGTYAADFGTMVRANKNITLAAVLRNLGPKLKFIEEGTPLPTALHLGVALKRDDRWTLSLEEVTRQRGTASLHMGLEYRPMPMGSLRIGYRTDAADSSAGLAGISAGLGIQVDALEISYAWKPMAELSTSHYFSFGYTFGNFSKQIRGRIK